jgi:hypothetical protein
MGRLPQYLEGVRNRKLLLGSLHRLSAVLIVTLIALACVPAQTRESEILDHHFDVVKIKQANLILALSTLANENGLPIGLEVAAARPNSLEREINLDLKNSTLRDVLNAMVRQDSRYAWTSRGGTIYVYPTIDRDPLLLDLLATSLREFTVVSDRTTYRLRARILDLPEIKVKLQEAKASPFVIALTGADYGKLGDDFSLHVSDVTLKSLLDQIILHSAQKFWVLNRVGESKEYVVLNF